MAALDQLKRNISDLVNDPRGYLEMVADRMNNSVMGRQGTVNHQGVGYRQLTDAERRQQIQTGVLDNTGGGGLGIIKAKGGNWLTGSVEGALKGLKTNARLFPDAKPSQLALDNWVEGPLTKYVKRDMATEGDPVRKLAEQGVLHTPMEFGGVSSNAYGLRQEFNGKPFGVAQSDLAKAWENASDALVMTGKPRTMSNAAFTDNPWLRNLDPETPVHQIARRGTGELGFTHLTDELRNALNPESGLPRNLLLTPEQMQQMGMEKAVRHVDAINKWRAAQQAEANAKLAQSPAVHTIREYGENNPKGLRWVEIKQPEDLPEGWADMTTNGSRFRNMNTGEIVGKDPRRNQLADQLKYEGDTMGHCVGGYCDEVAYGRSRIFSLRDAKGEPHVTIETQPRQKATSIDPFERGVTNTEEYVRRMFEEERGRPPHDFEELDEFAGDYGIRYKPGTSGDMTAGANIIQIKGKQNKKPNDEYLPFVQDFVKNHPEGGQWGTVGDLGNTGLRQLGNAFNEMERAKLKTLGHDISPTGYATEAEIQALHDAFNSASGEEIPLHMRGFADGGLINKPQVWEPVEGDGVTGFLLR